MFRYEKNTHIILNTDTLIEGVTFKIIFRSTASNLWNPCGHQMSRLLDLGSHSTQNGVPSAALPTTSFLTNHIIKWKNRPKCFVRFIRIWSWYLRDLSVKQIDGRQTLSSLDVLVENVRESCIGNKDIWRHLCGFENNFKREER